MLWQLRPLSQEPKIAVHTFCELNKISGISLKYKKMKSSEPFFTAHETTHVDGPPKSQLIISKANVLINLNQKPNEIIF